MNIFIRAAATGRKRAAGRRLCFGGSRNPSCVIPIIVSVIIGGILTAAMVGPRGAVAALGILGLVATLTTLIAIVFSIFAIIAMVQAYQYKEYRIPLVGGISDKVAGMFGGAAGK